MSRYKLGYEFKQVINPMGLSDRLYSLTPFQKLLVMLLSATFIVLVITTDSQITLETEEHSAAIAEDAIHLFYHPQCPHCHDAIAFLQQQENLPTIIKLDVTSTHGQHLASEIMRIHDITPTEFGVPLFVFQGQWKMGFDATEPTKTELINWFTQNNTVSVAESDKQKDIIDVPLFGEINLQETSLPVLTILLGLADGFNPCAMWVLVYLISIVAGLQDKRKIWWLVGSFVLASGVLYYLFMAAWLNTFLIIGYTRPLTLFIALIAIGFGINHLYELIRSRGEPACHVGDLESRQKTMGKIRSVINAPVSFTSIVGMIGLAFAVNAIEFVCSAALPAIYTHTLSLMDLSTTSYYLYILLYVSFFMLDDLVIFALAAFAAQKLLDSRYALYSRAIGGILLIGLGGWMLFPT